MSRSSDKGVMAEALFNGFIAFMMVMAISTVFVIGLTMITALCAMCGATRLVSIIWQTRPEPKINSRSRKLTT